MRFILRRLYLKNFTAMRCSREPDRDSNKRKKKKKKLNAKHLDNLIVGYKTCIPPNASGSERQPVYQSDVSRCSPTIAAKRKFRTFQKKRKEKRNKRCKSTQIGSGLNSARGYQFHHYTTAATPGHLRCHEPAFRSSRQMSLGFSRYHRHLVCTTKLWSRRLFISFHAMRQNTRQLNLHVEHHVSITCVYHYPRKALPVLSYRVTKRTHLSFSPFPVTKKKKRKKKFEKTLGLCSHEEALWLINSLTEH